MSQFQHLRLLLCWGYHRAGWIRPFEQLRDQFDIHYLFHRSPAEEEGCLTDAPRHYWLAFKDAASVIERIDPDRIVFMALDGAWVIALNAEARRRGIPTFIVQHGHFNPVDEGAEGLATRAVRQALQAGSPLDAVRFAGRSFGAAGGYRFVRTLRLMADARRTNAREAMRRHSFGDRMPDYYVALSPESAQIHLQLDGAPPDRIACIGVPEYDEIFRSVPTAVPDDGPVLLLDSPNAENRWNARATTIEEKIKFLRSLDETVAGMRCQLRVKLHPESYGAEWLPGLANGTYLRDASLVDEFSRASVCVGFDSTLMVPAVWLRPTIFVRLKPSRIAVVAEETRAAKVVEALEDIDQSLIDAALRRFDKAYLQRQAFAQRLAFSPDGQANERLGAILSNPSTGMQNYSLTTICADSVQRSS